MLSGPHAEVQISNDAPAFEFALPVDAKAEDLVAIAKPIVKATVREIEIFKVGLGVGPDSLKKRNLPVVIEELKGEAPLGGRFVRYRLKPSSRLPIGEYCLTIRGSYYDFEFLCRRNNRRRSRVLTRI